MAKEEMDEMVSRSNDGLAQYDGIENFTRFLGVRIELRRTLLDCGVLRDCARAHFLPLLWGGM